MGSGADWFRGLVAGAKLGPAVFVTELGLSLVYTEVVLERYGHAEFRYGDLGDLVLWMVGDLIIYIVVCILAGVLLAYLHDVLPGARATTKAMVLLVPLWFVFSIAQGLAVSATASVSLPYYDLWTLVMVLISPVYGYLLGWLWERQGPTDW